MLSHVFCDLNNIFNNLINILKLRRLYMDPILHEKIADKLMQYRGKIPKYGEVNDRIAKSSVWELTKAIEDLLWQIDNYAQAEANGWIR